MEVIFLLKSVFDIIAEHRASVERQASSGRGSGPREAAQRRHKERVCSFPLELLDRAAAILKPKRLRGSKTASLRQLEALRIALEKRRENGPGIDANSET